MPDHQTLVDLLCERACTGPGRPAYAFLADGEAESARLTYAGLDRASRAVAAVLRGAGCAGERALLLYPQGLEFVTAFWGCLYAGTVAVPAYPPRNPRGVPRLRAIVEDADPRVVLTTRALLEEVRPWFGEAAAGRLWLATDDLPAGVEDAWVHPGTGPADLAFLQYTSGSTSTPRGVMVSHANLLHNLRLLQEGWRQGPDSVLVSWLPLFHDMGLIGIALEAVHLGAFCVLMPPASFLQRPFRWLDAVSRYGGTLSGGPNFAFELAARRIPPEQRAGLDLSRWTAAFNGAEPVRRDTLERFLAAFAPCGLRAGALQPGYGLAEGTLVVSSGHAGDDAPLYASFGAAELEKDRLVERPDGSPGARSLVGCGRVLGDGQRVEIVDPATERACAPGAVGEIWVSGPSVAGGYWGRPEESAATFRARTADTGEGPFLRTGDLGFVHGGELFVAGRVKDLVIVRGRNLYPQDLELTAERAHPGVRPGSSAAFTLEAGGEERLVLVCEVERRHLRSDLASIAAAVLRALVEEHEVQPRGVVLLKTGGILKTTSGKIQRRGCRAALADGSLEVVHEWWEAGAGGSAAAPAAGSPQAPPPAPPLPAGRAGTGAVREWLTARVAALTGLPPREVDPGAPFAHWGLDSAAAVGLSGELAEWLGRTLPTTLLYDHPSIDALAFHLAGEEPAGSPSRPGERGGGAPGDVEPIAIVGIGCRFPGADGPEEFWRLLLDGVDAVSEVPADRWDLEELYDADPGAPGKMSTRWGGFLRDVDRFDAGFFGIAPREAARMDPQQRLLLEVAWEALEDAGTSPDSLAGSRTGVFVGISASDYGQLQFGDPALADAYAGTGGALSIAANRLSYVLDLRGPSMAVDTACSSSLVALHLACRSLWSGESATALAGGVNLLLSPGITVNFSKAGFMSPDGRCRAFDGRANGYVRSEGAGVVVLKPLSRARMDGDRVYAVVRAVAVNQDGRSNGLTAPSGGAQEAVLREAYARAGVDPADVRYVEAHGTGTALGDPIEARALGAVLGAGRPPGRPCFIGSAKTNVGHLEAAAGIVGIVKAALALKHRRLPPSLHFGSPNPSIPFAELGLAVQASASGWPDGEGPLVAGVSSFGFGGTNAHAVLAEAPAPGAEAAARPAPAAGAPLLLPLSARSAGALRDLAGRFRALLLSGAPPAPRDLAYTAAVRRAHHEHRLALVGSSPEELVGRLDGFLAGNGTPEVSAGRRAPGRSPRVAFVFSGQGPQWWGMGRELFGAEPAFRETVAEVDALLRPYAGWSLVEELLADEAATRLDRTDVAQPALFALQAGLAALWRSRGIRPDAVVGHSVGEVAAAHAAGVLTLEEAVRVVFHRGRAMQAATGMGAMAAAQMSPGEAREAIEPYGGLLSVAAVNGPASVVLSGDGPALSRLLAALEDRGVPTRRLPVAYAFHSAQVAPAAAELVVALAGLAPRAAAVPVFSTVLGREAGGPEMGADYWARGVRETVLFAAAVEGVVAGGCDALVEIGPHPVLAGALAQTLEQLGAEAAVLPSLRRGTGERETMLASLGALYALGSEVDWTALHPGGGRVVDLPAYPWQRERHWLAPAPGAAVPRVGRPGASHPLLGARVSLAHSPGTHLWEAQVDPATAARLCPPGVALPEREIVELVRAAAEEALGPGAYAVEEPGVAAPLVLEAPQTVQLVLAAADGTGRFHLYARRGAGGGGEWTLHAAGAVVPAGSAAPGRGDGVPSRDDVLAADPGERAALLERYLQGRLGGVLRVAPAEVDADRPVTRLGLDSLMAVELRNALMRDLGASPGVAALLAGPTLRELAASLLPQLAAAGARAGPEGPAAEERGPAPLSYGQRAMWLLQQLHPESALFNVFAAIRVAPALDPAALRRALQALVDRHAALRTAFPAGDEGPTQEVAEGVAVALAEVGADGWDEDVLRERLESEAHRPFDLERPPLLRATLFRRGPGEDVLLLVLHHLVVDFWSNVLILGELTALYEAERGGAPAPLPEAGLPFTAYARRQERELAGPEGERLWAYWREQLSGALPLRAPAADRRPAARTDAGAVSRFRAGGERALRLRELAAGRGVTLYTLLLAAWHVLLHRWAAEDDVLVASPMAARDGAEWEGTVGCFSNLVLLRGDLSGRPGFGTVLDRTRETVLDALRHQGLPLHLLAERIPALRDPGRGAPAPVMFVFNRPHRLEEAGIAAVMVGEPGARFSRGGLEMEALPVDERTTPCDLCLWAAETDGDLSMRLQYAADLFEPATVGALASSFLTLLDGVLDAPDRFVGEVPLLDEHERRRVLDASAGPAPLAAPAVHEAFEAQAVHFPAAVALVDGAETVTCAELNARANRLAWHLAALGAGPDSLIAVCLERSAELIVTLLAVLKAGGAYVPLDPAYPEERLEQMLRDSGARLLVTRRGVGDGLDAPGLRRVRVDADRAAIAERPERDPGVRVDGDSLAYVIYTSGSTGTPKGVMVGHAALANHTGSVLAAYGLGPEDRVLQFASPSFDASVEEIFPALACGAALVLRPEWVTGSATDFLGFCGDAGVTVLDLPTAYWHVLVPVLAAGDAVLPGCVRLVILGGERALPERVAAWKEAVGASVRLVNTYGPTEATVVATRHDVAEAPEGGWAAREVPIGRPIRGVSAHVLDAAMHPVPDGATGELYLGGAGLSRGYLGHPALTAGKFVPDPFSGTPGCRLYATGDRARRRAGGELEFVGRVDGQVKVRGFRVEPGEVEAALRRHPDVRDAAVLAREDAPGDRRLAAYVVARPGPAPAARELRELLGELLPPYMVPSSFVFLHELPVTPGGKLDRRALPAPESGAGVAPEGYVPPGTPVEEVLAGIWAGVLGRERVGVHDSFFELGGDSVLAVQVMVRARKAGLPLHPRQLFQHSSVSRLAAVLDASALPSAGPDPVHSPAQTAQAT